MNSTIKGRRRNSNGEHSASAVSATVVEMAPTGSSNSFIARASQTEVSKEDVEMCENPDSQS